MSVSTAAHTEPSAYTNPPLPTPFGRTQDEPSPSPVRGSIRWIFSLRVPESIDRSLATTGSARGRNDVECPAPLFCKPRGAPTAGHLAPGGASRSGPVTLAGRRAPQADRRARQTVKPLALRTVKPLALRAPRSVPPCRPRPAVRPCRPCRSEAHGIPPLEWTFRWRPANPVVKSRGRPLPAKRRRDPRLPRKPIQRADVGTTWLRSLW